MDTVYVRMSRSKLKRILYSIPREAKQDGHPILERAGKVVLRRVEKAFLIKSRSGTDECGERWAALSPVTLLKRRRKRTKTRDQDRPSAALSASQRDLWWSYYRRALFIHREKYIAARVAWSQLHRKVLVIQFDKYGAASYDILRDIGLLLRSLRLGAIHNVFRVGRGEVELGTDRRGARAHHTGAKKLPQRRLWPHPRKWTSSWWQEVLVDARVGLVQLITEKLK